MRSLKIALVAATALGGASLIAPAASAMPISGLAPAANELATDVQPLPGFVGRFAAGGAPVGVMVIAATGARAPTGAGAVAGGKRSNLSASGRLPARTPS